MTSPAVTIERWGAGVPILCLHGLGGGAHFFGGIGPLLAARAQVLAFDLPGSGFAPTPGGFTFARAAAAAVDVLRDEPAPAWLLGHSLGIIVALEVLRRVPERIAGVIGIGGLPEPRPDARARISARIATIRERGLTGVGRAVAAGNMAERTRRERPEVVALFARLLERQDAEGYCSTAQALVDWHAPALPDLGGRPAVLLTGAEDTYAPADAVAAFAAALSPSASVEVLPECGHLPFLERPALCAEAVQRALSREA